MLTIWGRSNSNNVKKVLWCAEELGIEYRRIDAGGAFGVINEPEYLAKNPNGLVPMIEDGDFVLWESNAIIRYLASSQGADAIWPQDAKVRASADRWMDWFSSSFMPAFRPLFIGLVRTPQAQRDPAVIEQARLACEAQARLLEAYLAEQPWFTGTSFGLGDIPLGCFLNTWFELPIERPSLPALEDWHHRLAQRPAFQRAVMTPLS